MRKFAKIFGPDTDQVVAIRTPDECGRAAIRLYHQRPDGGVRSITAAFGPAPENHLQANLVFDALDEAAARKMLADAKVAS